MNRKDGLFLIEEPKKPVKQKIKEITEKLSDRWEYDEAFIEALHTMNTDKVFVFKRVYRRGVIYYSIKLSDGFYRHPFLDDSCGRVFPVDLEFIKNFFTNAGWEVLYMYCKNDPVKSLERLHIRGRK
jgi:hypothetical protein